MKEFKFEDVITGVPDMRIVERVRKHVRGAGAGCTSFACQNWCPLAARYTRQLRGRGGEVRACDLYVEATNAGWNPATLFAALAAWLEEFDASAFHGEAGETIDRPMAIKGSKLTEVHDGCF